MSNKRARFWKYTGNHPNGKNHIRVDVHNYGIELVSAMEYWGTILSYMEPLTYADVMQIKVIKHTKGADKFGYEVTVSAPQEVWMKGQLLLNKIKETV